MNNNYYCIIMAGGMGRRTFDRYKQIIPTGNIYITTHKDYEPMVRKQLPELQESQVLVEEERRNTAPAIAYASHVIQKINPKY